RFATSHSSAPSTISATRSRLSVVIPQVSLSQQNFRRGHKDGGIQIKDVLATAIFAGEILHAAFCVSARQSQSLAKFQSRNTVFSETCNTSAISFASNPPKNFSSTT